MCGILGIIDQSDHPVTAADIRPGLELLSHRGPDGAGVYTSGNFALGHRRLAIFDLSAQGDQPMHYQERTIIFNGAIYNFPELKDELSSLGHRFRSTTDTEVILAAYVQWGTDCVTRFNGQWAFAIYDPLQNLIFCSRDRFGIKPFYYAVFGGRFHFASEIKAFTGLAGWAMRLNPIRAYEWLAYGLHDHTIETLYEGVYQLVPGSCLIYQLRDHSVDVKRYYRVGDHEVAHPITLAGSADRFREQFREAVRLRLRADVTVGSALSGGLDSSSVVSVMAGMTDRAEMTTVSACFPAHPAIDESAYIDALKERYGFHSRRITPDVATFGAFERQTTWHQDEPLTGSGAIAQFLVFREARAAGIKVMLDGQGADEILAGYQKFFAPYFRSLLRRKPWMVLPAFWNFLFLHQWSPAKVIHKLTELDARTKGLEPAWMHEAFRPDPERLYHPQPFRNMRELSLQLISEMGLPALLHYEDRNAMAFGVESRLPFLDHHLVELALSLPDDHRIHHGKRKMILREAMRDYLPPVIRQRYDKLGFAVPEWSPSVGQLQKAQGVFLRMDPPILAKDIDLTRLPAGIRRRIYYFALFLEQWLS